MGTKFKNLHPLTDAEEAEIQAQIAADPDDFEATDEQLAAARPFREVLPDLAKSIDREIARRGRPPLDNPKEAVTLRLDPDVVARFKAKGSDWRTRMAALIEKAS